MKKFIFAAICALPILSLEANLSGTYSVEGYDPTIGSSYTGTAVIEKLDDVYNINWTFNDGSHDTGTGLHVREELSFAFQGVETPSLIGVQVYKIEHEHHLKGPWVYLGDDRVGSEKLTRIDCE